MKNCGINRKITARVGKTPAFTDRDRYFGLCHTLYLTKWKIVAPSTKPRQSVILLHLPTKFEVSVDDMSVFSWFLLNRKKIFGRIEKSCPFSVYKKINEN